MVRFGPQVAALAILSVVLTTACTGDRTKLTDGTEVELTGSDPKILRSVTNVTPTNKWTGILTYVPDCNCVVLKESGPELYFAYVAWPPGSSGFTDGESRGVSSGTGVGSPIKLS